MKGIEYITKSLSFLEKCTSDTDNNPELAECIDAICFSLFKLEDYKIFYFLCKKCIDIYKNNFNS